MPTSFSVAILMCLSAQALGGASADLSPQSPAAFFESNATQVALGKALFETHWSPAGGVGPLFNATSCSACHERGNRSQALLRDGAVPTGLVIQLESPKTARVGEPNGDPTYGRIFSTMAVAGVQAEGSVTVLYTEIAGYYYPFGGRWSMRVPHYRLSGLTHGPLARTTIVKPRVAPALYGAGFLDAVSEAAINTRFASGTVAWHVRDETRSMGRFGWDAGTVSVRDQTASAFALEMGLTSRDRAHDDCTPVEVDCLGHSNGSTAEVADEIMDAVVAYVRTLPVPLPPEPSAEGAQGSRLFTTLGCAACHRPQLPVQSVGPSGIKQQGVIAPYTDLRTHELGTRMADQTVSGIKVSTHWRTAPLWGLGFRLRNEDHPTFLHDGRARSLEEAVLWHSGEAARSERSFESVGPLDREILLNWLATL